MATAMVSAAFSVLGKALAPFTDNLLKDWAASVELGNNVSALELELLSVQALLEPTLGKEIDNSALKEILVMLQDLGYDAEDVLDELDYFHIQDDLDGTFDAANKHAKGCTHNLALNLKAVGKQIICLPACLSATATGAKANRGINRCKAKLASRSCCKPIHTVGKNIPCSSLPYVCGDDGNDDDNSTHGSIQRNLANEPSKLRFNRIDASKRIQHIVEQLQLVQQKVSGIISTLGSNWSTVPNIAQSRPDTTSESIEPKLYGRDLMMNTIIHDIRHGKHSGEALTVIPVVGPGGIGKTTLAQYIYHNGEVQNHFNVKVWTCVSLNFKVNRLIEEIEKYVPKVDGESIGTAGELIGERLKNKRFLLVLDDMWDCSNEDEWKQLLIPFKKSQVKGNIIIVTTRFPAQAEIVKTVDDPIYLHGLDHKDFSELFLQIVFGNDKSIKDHKLLLETGDKIVARLKGSPLAAKTVGRLLKTQLDLVHWTRVLENKEWEQSAGKNDIMPALKLSYDYLPSQLQQCFFYCALFPQGYKFKEEELINFWIGLDVLHSSCGENKWIEDLGLSYLTQLVNHGFFEKERREDGSACCYIIHDLLHELARRVSSHECLSIDSCESQVSSLQVRPSIRHLSINIDDTNVKDRLTLKNCMNDFSTLDKRLKVEKLRSLMLFGEHHGCFVKAFGDLFREAKALRVVFLSEVTYDVEALLHNFYNLLHLRYLRIQSSSLVQTRFPNKISRFYHMMVLDAKHCYIVDLPRDMSNLVKLRHFLVRDDIAHSSIVEVGKLKSLQELRRFVVKQEGQGFELGQIGHLVELCGSLSIANLENVRAMEEADAAKLEQKSRLHELILYWNIHSSTSNSALAEDVLERLKPSSNLLKLSIIGHGGATCPSWLGMNLSIRSLESLCLDGVAWKTFRPIGELWLVNAPGEEISGSIPNKMFEKLRRLQLVNLRSLKKWAVHAPCQLFPFLEEFVIRGCSELVELLFSHDACCQHEKEACAVLFPRLTQLAIGSCPRLLSFPPVPWTESPCSIEIEGIGSSCLHKLVGAKNSSSEYTLVIEGKDTPGSTFWNVLAFHNLTKLKELKMFSCQPLPLHHLQMLSSLRTLWMSCSSNAFSFAVGDRNVHYQFPVESMLIQRCSASGKELTQMLTYFPKLSDLELWKCDKITGLGVLGQQATATATPEPSSSANRVDKAKIEQDIRAEEEIVESAEEGLLLLPPQLQELWIWFCPGLRLLSNPINDSKEDGRTVGGGGLQGLRSLRRLKIVKCPKLLSSYSSSFPFPNSLENLSLTGTVGMETLEPLTNLSSLINLSIAECGDLRGEGLLSLLTHGHLTTLQIRQTPNFFVGSETSSGMDEQEQALLSYSSKLQALSIHDVAGATALPMSSLLFSSLTTLELNEDKNVERFVEDQEAIQFANSLEEIKFLSCSSLLYLPARLHRLPNLKRLQIWGCEAIHMLPKDGFPSSLEELDITNCPQIQSLPKDCLPSSLQILLIRSCPAIRSLPKLDDLPSSLRELDVSNSRSEELRRQSRKLIGIIPIVKA